MAPWASLADEHLPPDVSETNAVEQTTNGDGAVEQTKEEAVNGHADSESPPASRRGASVLMKTQPSSR